MSLIQVLHTLANKVPFHSESDALELHSLIDGIEDTVDGSATSSAPKPVEEPTPATAPVGAPPGWHYDQQLGWVADEPA